MPKVPAATSAVSREPEAAAKSTGQQQPIRMEPLRIRNVPAPTGPIVNSAPQRLLVVDDLPEICQIFKDLHRRMRQFRVELVTETNSQRALDLAQKESFDLVVSDFRMRQVDGIEVLKAAAQKNPRGYRVLMTGYNEIPTSVQRIREAKVDAYVQKPLHAQDLLLLLLGLLQEDARLIDQSRAHARELEEQADASTVAFA